MPGKAKAGEALPLAGFCPLRNPRHSGPDLPLGACGRGLLAGRALKGSQLLVAVPFAVLNQVVCNVLHPLPVLAQDGQCNASGIAVASR